MKVGVEERKGKRGWRKRKDREKKFIFTKEKIKLYIFVENQHHY
jgi:hypothetical protein